MNLSIYTRTLLLLGTVLTIVTVFDISWKIIDKTRDHERELYERLDQLTDLQAHSIANSLWNLNRENTIQILYSLESNPDFFSARVVTDTGRIFAQIGDGNRDPHTVITKTAPVVYRHGDESSTIGSLSISFSLDRLRFQRAQSIKNSILSSGVQLAAVLIITLFSLHLIIRPLVSITNRIIALAKDDIDSEIPHIERKDQIGDMARAIKVFKENLLQIQQMRKEETAINLELSRARDAAETAHGELAQQNKILEIIAKGHDLQFILESIVKSVEAQIETVACSILILKGGKLYCRAAPSLSETYCRRLDGFDIGPNAGSCGMAAFKNSITITENIETDPQWTGFRDLAIEHGLRSCWSTPIRDGDGNVLGTFCSYFKTTCRPTNGEKKNVEMASKLAGLAIHRYNVENSAAEVGQQNQKIFDQLKAVMEGTSSNVGQEFFRSLVRNLASSLDVRYALLGLYVDEAVDTIQTIAFWDGDRFRDNIEFDISNSPFEQVIRLRRTQLFGAAIQSRFPDDEMLKDMGIESFLGLPLLGPVNNPTGLLVVMDNKPIINSANHEMILTIFASRAEVELDRDRKVQELILAKSESDQANKSKSDFLSSISHELRTPLNAILGYSELLKMNSFGTLNEKQNDAITAIHDSGKHLLTLISDLLEISKIDAGVMSPNLENVDIGALFNSVLKMFTVAAKEKNLRITMDLHPSLTTVPTDIKITKQVLTNLLSNALKFSPRNEEIGVRISPLDRQTVKFEIRDNGVGIDKNDHDNIFSEFYQVDQFRDRQLGGSGLGLPLSRRLIETLGGTMGIVSQPNQGSTFWFTIPRPTQAITIDETIQHPSVRDPDLVPNNYKVLVAEDNKSNMEIIIEMLNLQGYIVIISENGKDAVQKIKEFRPDLVLMDMQMPIMDGYTATKEVRELPDFEHLPIIALTASADRVSMERAFSSGCTDHITKPFTFEKLHSVIKQHLSV